MASRLFEETKINDLKLANRFVRSATWEGLASENGACTPRLSQLMGELARGSVGLIISSHTYVRGDGQAGPWQLGIYDDTLDDGLRRMTREVHKQGGRIIAQITHAGLFANTTLTRRIALAPSALEEYPKLYHRMLSVEEIHVLEESFSEAALRAKRTGFDGIQIHAAHGYLLSQFLSPVFNKRIDDYGGSLENQARFPLEVVRSVRVAVGRDYPVFIKMNSEDFLKGGLNVKDSLEFGHMLQEEGIDAIELSGGTDVSGRLGPIRLGIKTKEQEAYFRNASKMFKKELNLPIILVGGIRSFELAEKLMLEGYADYISMSRPFIREPFLVRRWASGDLARAKCVSDNECFKPIRAGEGVYCVVERKQSQK
jgi:2,4-dienoyl-CoA reductase-like NADH-dependent reductase (Old Yellow Enzyme family)